MTSNAGTPHAADVPFVFGTTAHPHLARKVGHGAGAIATAHAMMRMWASFAWTGDQTAEEITRWPRFSAERPEMMTIGAAAGVAAPTRAPRDAELACWPAFRGGAT